MIDARQGANDRCGADIGTDHRARGARRPAPENRRRRGADFRRDNQVMITHGNYT